jgi:hypothetical protein
MRELALLLAMAFGTLAAAQPPAEKQTTQTTSQTPTRPARAFTVPPMPSPKPCPTVTTVTIRDLEEQMDVVAGKRRKTLALLEQVSTWYEIDQKHPDALAKSRELRQFWQSFEFNYVKLLEMFKVALDKKVLSMPDSVNTLSDEIDSKLRQLQAMGFELKGDGWKSYVPVIDAKKWCYVVTDPEKL